MNEKLTQIAIKAQVEHCISHVRLKEFADLIVKECASLASEGTSLPYDSYSEKIKKHFGVE
jgi:hypothetical protein